MRPYSVKLSLVLGMKDMRPYSVKLSLVLGMKDPITYRQVREYIRQCPSIEEAIRYLASLRDARWIQRTQLFAQAACALDFVRMAIYTNQYSDKWFTEEVGNWVDRQYRLCGVLGDEHNALQAGIDELLSL